MHKNQVGFVIFLLVSLADIVGIAFNIPVLILIFKPLIIPSLLLLYVFSVQKRNKTYIMALIFSFFGDVFLLSSEEINFMAGLGSFLIAHILFIKIVLKRIQTTKASTIVIAIIPYFLLLVGLLKVLYSSLNELLIPVIIYGITISLFGVVALIDFLNSKSKQAYLMLVGSTFFIVSDSFLAINKFYLTNKLFAVTVMITYVVAQFFIFKSMVVEENSRS